jgi:hypothetical protein
MNKDVSLTDTIILFHLLRTLELSLHFTLKYHFFNQTNCVCRYPYNHHTKPHGRAQSTHYQNAWRSKGPQNPL